MSYLGALGFALGRHNAGAVDAQALGPGNEAELDRLPVEARQHLKGTKPLSLETSSAVGLQVVGEHRIHQQRNVPE